MSAFGGEADMLSLRGLMMGGIDLKRSISSRGYGGRQYKTRTAVVLVLDQIAASIVRSEIGFHSDKTKFSFPINTGTNQEFVGMSLEIIELSADS
jgi:hypothetical protein